MNPQLFTDIIQITLLLCVIAAVVRWILFARNWKKNKFLYGFFGLLACATGFGLILGILTLLFLNFDIFNALPFGFYGQSIFVFGSLAIAMFSTSETLLFLLRRRFSKKEPTFALEEIGRTES
ncbi:hypothetical protein [Flavobacterium sp.]|uniref:hypothetical protein n=1 Tax=Flavobacterium sp. TaxID=239 RepID=UPI001220C290|nr:hypothetical protein [Flavobacterium sp.]RZJ71199.1 MAG: hypothetical protein EOO49_10635 [Flavobacterium sp.]